MLKDNLYFIWEFCKTIKIVELKMYNLINYTQAGFEYICNKLEDSI